MNLIPILLILNLTVIQEADGNGPKVKKLDDQNNIEIFNSIDYFKQYHSNSFKINLFRRTCNENLELNGFPLSNYIVAIYNYSETGSPQLYEIGSFYNPEIMLSQRQGSSIRFSIDHGEFDQRTSSTLVVTKDGVEMLD